MLAPDIIKTSRLIGTRVAASDLPYVVSIDTNVEVQKTLFGTTHTLEESKARLGRWLQHWNDYGFGFWIFRTSASEQVGHAGIFHSPRAIGSIEVGYALPPEHWSQGYATEMTLGVLKIAFEVLHLSRIIAIAQATNLASRRVMEKCGLTFDREYVDKDGASVLYACTREGWLSFTGSHTH